MSDRHYHLGIDLGTTYSAAAVCRDEDDGRPEVVALGPLGAPVASVAFVATDGSMLTGEAARRRALTDPRRVAREFKRRIGDNIPVVIGGYAVPAEVIAARFVAAIVDQVAEREGGPPSSVALTHPVDWGPHKQLSMTAALAAEGLRDVAFLTEPQAAAVGYADGGRIDDGTVAIYDLGGGTFDAAVVRRLPDGAFEVLGQPTGIEHLGGVDFDEAVFDHVRRSIGAAWDGLDATDPAVLTAVAGLRRECTAAKEGLTADTEVTIPVMLPGIHTQIRLCRSEFEDMIRPAIAETVEALQRTIASAGVSPGELRAVLLAGGSSRIPLVAQLVSAELGRPIAVDADPKVVIATGAAVTARGPWPTHVVEPEECPARPVRGVVRPSAGDDGLERPRYRRTLSLAAGIAVLGSLGLTATLASGVNPMLPAQIGQALAGGVADASEAALDPWTGFPLADTTTAGPNRVTAVAAAVRPVARIVDTGAAGASPATPVVVAPATAPAATSPGPAVVAPARAPARAPAVAPVVAPVVAPATAPTTSAVSPPPTTAAPVTTSEPPPPPPATTVAVDSLPLAPDPGPPAAPDTPPAPDPAPAAAAEAPPAGVTP